MKINACSVAFRHLDVSAADLARYVMREGFDGLEIWLPHARAMAEEWAALSARPHVPMLAGYLPVGLPGFDAAEAEALCILTRQWGAGRLRLFAGNLGSAEATPERRDAILRDLRKTAQFAALHGLRVAIETHPDTLADAFAETLGLLEDLDHPAIGVNFDVLHVWESGADPLAAHAKLAPHILHYHLKNVTARDCLTVFNSGNVHDPAGSRQGMCPLFEGVLDYTHILAALPWTAEASLEWFGPEPAATMATDLSRARAVPAIAAA